MALANNFDHFLGAIEYVFLIVLIHNAIALGAGYLMGTIFNRPIEDRKTIAIETGIQNSGLALVLIFNPKIFPPEMELGGMAIIAAWWGIWHIIAGLGIAGIWTNFNFGLRKVNHIIQFFMGIHNIEKRSFFYSIIKGLGGFLA